MALPYTAPGRYVGPDAALRGKTALLRRKLCNYDVWLVQFDELGLTSNNVRLDSGWHEFPLKHFKSRRYRCG